MKLIILFLFLCALACQANTVTLETLHVQNLIIGGSPAAPSGGGVFGTSGQVFGTSGGIY